MIFRSRVQIQGYIGPAADAAASYRGKARLKGVEEGRGRGTRSTYKRQPQLHSKKPRTTDGTQEGHIKPFIDREKYAAKARKGGK